MGRKTQQNKITSPELLEQVNSKNTRLLNDFIDYLKSVQRSENTIKSYKNDIEIFFVWNLQNNNDKFFVDIAKRDIISYQNWLLNNNGNSPARVRRLKAALSSISNYISNVLDDEYPDFRPIINKIESPVNQPVMEKTVLEDEQIQTLLDYLVGNKEYCKACVLALAACSGSRKSELVRFKTDYFTDEDIIYGSLYKTPEKLRTKGRGLGKYIHRYVLVKEFKPYLDLWLKQREELGIESEYLFVIKKNGEWIQMKPTTLNSYAKTFSRVLGIPFYFHSLRHYFTTHLSQSNVPHSVIKEIIGWEDLSMVLLYDDTPVDEEIGKYFDEGGIKQVEQKSLSDL